MSLENLSAVLVRDVTKYVLEKNEQDPELFANSDKAIVDYFHIEVGVQKELLKQLVNKIERENGLTERPTVKKKAE